jgi:hypothetical protein
MRLMPCRRQVGAGKAGANLRPNPVAERGMALRRRRGRTLAAEMDKGTAPYGIMAKEQVETGATLRELRVAVKDIPTQSGSR